MSQLSVLLPAQLELFKQRFKNEVTYKHIKYDWDSGSCYSIISHPIMDEYEELIQRVAGDEYDFWYDEWIVFTDEFLSEHEDKPSDAIHVNADGTATNQYGDEFDVDESIEVQLELLAAGKANDVPVWYLISAANDSVLAPEVQAELKIKPRPVFNK